MTRSSPMSTQSRPTGTPGRGSPTPSPGAGSTPTRSPPSGAPRILFLTQVLPYPPDAGPKIRAYHVLRYLAEHARVHLVSFTRDTDTPEAEAHLLGLVEDLDCVPIHRSRLRDLGTLTRCLLQSQSFIIERDRVAEMGALIDRLAGDAESDPARAFDAVHADQLWMTQYARRYAASVVDEPHLVHDAHNAVFMIFERLARHQRNPLARMVMRREADRLAHYEVGQLCHFDHTVFVTDEDRSAVARAAASLASSFPEPCDPVDALRSATSVIPIGVDVGGREVIRPSAAPKRVTVLGTMYWPPNVEGVLWLAKAIWPRVAQDHPDAVLTIIGKDPPNSVAGLSRSGDGAIEVIGYIEDPRPLLAETAAFVVPLLSGGGMRVKILDAWSWGLPVVSTRLGAEGIAASHGDDILLADEAADFAEAIGGLLSDSDLRERIGFGGRRTVESAYDTNAVYRQFADAYAPVFGQRD